MGGVWDLEFRFRVWALVGVYGVSSRSVLRRIQTWFAILSLGRCSLKETARGKTPICLKVQGLRTLRVRRHPSTDALEDVFNLALCTW